MIIQFCGLPGSGKTTLANNAKEVLCAQGIKTEIIDGDVYRKTICRDLGFSRQDRDENIRRLANAANNFSMQGIVAIICAVNPYEATRHAVVEKYKNVKTVFMDCDLETLIHRDPKGLYRRALLPEGNQEKLYHFTGISDPFESPSHPDLIINTSVPDIETCAGKLIGFIKACRPIVPTFPE